MRFGEKGDPIKAKVAGTDPSTDLALLKIDPSKADGRPLRLGSSDEVRVGEPVIAIGSPFGLRGTVTSGIVSGLGREIQSPNGFTIDEVVQTDAAINPGNSGGPLIDDRGRVIGVNAQIASNGNRSNSGVGFAIPIDTAKDVIPELRRSGEVKRAYLGVSSAAVDSGVARELNLPADRGALVQEVVRGGPADKAGLRGGQRQTQSGLSSRRRPDREGRRQGDLRPRRPCGRDLVAQAGREGPHRVLPRRPAPQRSGDAWAKGLIKPTRARKPWLRRLPDIPAARRPLLLRAAASQPPPLGVASSPIKRRRGPCGPRRCQLPPAAV